MTANNYAKAIYELDIPYADILAAGEIIKETPELERALANPAISAEEKRRVIDSIFPEGVRNLVKYLCDRSHIGSLPEIIRAYSGYRDSMEGIIRASLVCVNSPDEEQLNGLKTFLCRRFNGREAVISVSYDKSLIGGFVLSACGMEFDRSLKGSLNGLMTVLSCKS